MHDHARAFVEATVYGLDLAAAPDILDLGGRDVNGTIHDLFYATPFVVDIIDGPGVDWVGNAAEYRDFRRFQVVLCTEVFEHTPEWPAIVQRAYEALHERGVFIATMARGRRPAHSAVTGGRLEPGAFYQNVDPADLTEALAEFSTYQVFAADGVFGGDDLYCWAIK